MRAIMTISVDRELRKRIQEHPEVNWSEVAREAFNERLVKMEQSQNMKSTQSKPSKPSKP